MNLQSGRPLSAWSRLIAVNVGSGLTLGFIVAATLIILDIQGLGTLLRNSDQAFVAVTLLMSGFAALAAAGLVSTAVMMIAGVEPQHRHQRAVVRVDNRRRS